MILKRERLWTLYANAKDQEARNYTTAGQNHDQELKAIQAKYEQLKTQLLNAENERNNFALRLLRQPTDNDIRGTPIMEATARRSVKMPNAPIIDDGKDMDFDV